MFRFLIVCLLLVGCDRQKSQPARTTITPQKVIKKTWAQKRAETPAVFKEPLVKHAESSEAPPAGFSVVRYTSHDSNGDELRLLAWLAMPADSESHASGGNNESDSPAEIAKTPAVVYFHSGHELGASDCEEVRPFIHAGFAVLMPTLRGENGNSGGFEMFLGEIDDAMAAVQWLADQTEIDSDRIYSFGHSTGGGVSAMLALIDQKAPIRFGGSCGGLYRTKNLRDWQPPPPFESDDDGAFKLRTLVDNAGSMQRKHIAYLGLADVLSENFAYVNTKQLEERLVLGDHISSLPIAITDFAGRIFKDAFPSKSLPKSLRPILWKYFDDVPTQSVVPDHEPELWNVQADPTSETIEHYAGDVRCEILMRDRRGFHGDFIFPRGFQSVARFHAMNGAPTSGVNMIDLKTMLVGRRHPDAVFPILHKNSYSYGGDQFDRFAFRWPGTNKPTDSAGVQGVTIPWGIFAASPGGRYVAGFSDKFELLVWEAATMKLVGRNPLPKLSRRKGQPDGSHGRLTPAESGFSPDGKEFAAVVGEIGNMYLINYHWESGAITSFFPTVTPWTGHRSVKYPNRYRLQFLEDGHGWLVEYGKRIIDRNTGKRRGAFAFEQVDRKFYRMDTATFTVPRVISGNRVLVVNQDPADLFHQQIQTVNLKLTTSSQD